MMIHGRVVLAIVCCLGVACDYDHPSRREVEPLVASHATRQEVERKLEAGYTWYGSDGSPEIAPLREFLSRESPVQYKPLRAAVAEGRRIMFNTTEWQQTWLFFDDSDRLVGYWFNSQ
jgi:hypothetical protein